MDELWTLPFAIAMLLGAALLTLLGGVRLSVLGDTLADRLGLGEAIFGTIFLGSVIALSGIVMTATAALEGYPRLAYSNAVGGVAAQTAVIGIADLVYRKANLEHAAASLTTMLFATVLIAMLCTVMLVRQTPDVTLWGIHPGSFVLVLMYLAGIKLVRSGADEPLWVATRTAHTVTDEPPEDDPHPGRSTLQLGLRFAMWGALVACAGWAVVRAAGVLVERAGIDESVVGAVIMGLTNAMPELVTSIAAVRRGAVTLAVGGILGGNAFDTLNVAVGDVAYRQASLYHVASTDEVTMTMVTILMVTVILSGMLRRQPRGPGRIGYEGLVMLAIYVGALLLVALT